MAARRSSARQKSNCSCPLSQSKRYTSGLAQVTDLEGYCIFDSMHVSCHRKRPALAVDAPVSRYGEWGMGRRVSFGSVAEPQAFRGKNRQRTSRPLQCCCSFVAADNAGPQPSMSAIQATSPFPHVAQDDSKSACPRCTCLERPRSLNHKYAKRPLSCFENPSLPCRAYSCPLNLYSPPARRGQPERLALGAPRACAHCIFIAETPIPRDLLRRQSGKT